MTDFIRSPADMLPMTDGLARTVRAANVTDTEVEMRRRAEALELDEHPTVVMRDELVEAVVTREAHLQRAERFLRDTCEMYRVDPPSVEDVRAWASVAFDVTDEPVRPEAWLDDFIGERETAAGERCQAIFGLLDRYARLDDGSAQAVADLSEDARFASPCDPCVLVLVTHDGSAIVADLAGGDVQTFGAELSWRERRAQRRRDRRAYCRDRRLYRDASRIR